MASIELHSVALLTDAVLRGAGNRKCFVSLHRQGASYLRTLDITGAEAVDQDAAEHPLKPSLLGSTTVPAPSGVRALKSYQW